MMYTTSIVAWGFIETGMQWGVEIVLFKGGGMVFFYLIFLYDIPISLRVS